MKNDRVATFFTLFFSIASVTYEEKCLMRMQCFVICERLEFCKQNALPY